MIVAVPEDGEREAMMAELLQLCSGFSPVHTAAVAVLHDNRRVVTREVIVQMLNRMEADITGLRITYGLIKREEPKKVATAPPPTPSVQSSTSGTSGKRGGRETDRRDAERRETVQDPKTPRRAARYGKNMLLSKLAQVEVIKP